MLTGRQLLGRLAELEPFLVEGGHLVPPALRLLLELLSGRVEELPGLDLRLAASGVGLLLGGMGDRAGADLGGADGPLGKPPPQEIAQAETDEADGGEGHLTPD